jgi:hypothetical protein
MKFVKLLSVGLFCFCLAVGGAVLALNGGFPKWGDEWNVEYVGYDLIIRQRNATERFLGATEINNVFSADGRLFEAFRVANDSGNIGLSPGAVKNAAVIAKYAKDHPDSNVYFMLAPTAAGIYSDTVPKSAGLADQRRYIYEAYRLADNENTLNLLSDAVECVDVYTPLYNARKGYVYYRTDHHWTGYGTEIARNAFAAAAGLPNRMFTITPVISDLRGSLYNKTLDKKIEPDILSKYTAKSNITLSAYNENSDGVLVPKHYDNPYPFAVSNYKDTYAEYFGVYYAVLEYHNESQKNGKRLLLVKDSYGNSLAPLLALDYADVTVLELRKSGADTLDYVNRQEYDDVLVMYNAPNFDVDTELRRLR